MAKWEYRTCQIPATGWVLGGNLDGNTIEDRTNRLGAEGWEAVSALSANQFMGASRSILILLKRRIEE